ncbi:trihelix transcription factor GTL2 [Andrographis paniculata]|uniref:trihelix transcription factor GTL2 n=1 Tax=Andrographis paniculata TaxID=175694 RepID=UPI0021E7A642|nr:trihelix transcription factor GTL2 [Andrographis paniculata]
MFGDHHHYFPQFCNYINNNNYNIAAADSRAPPPPPPPPSSSPPLIPAAISVPPSFSSFSGGGGGHGFDHHPPSELVLLHNQHHIMTNVVGGKNKIDLINSSSSDSADAGLGHHLLLHQDQLDRSVPNWSNDELLALFKLRSTHWGHVSRKLEEMGFKRSANECKQKLEEGKHFDGAAISYNELDEFYGHDAAARVSDHETRPCRDNTGKTTDAAARVSDHETRPCRDNTGKTTDAAARVSDHETRPCRDNTGKTTDDAGRRERKKKKKKKRKRDDGDGDGGGKKMERLRRCLEAVVDKVMAQQEAFHEKLIEAIVKRDEETAAREEAWKAHEMNRSKIEIETRAKDQATAEERHAAIIGFLEKFTHKSQFHHQIIPNSSTNYSTDHDEPPPPPPQEGGKRWPREEVLALINQRCNKYESGGQRGPLPLWERVSKGMMEMGYRRSAKRCKEKWENINKYFRKTRDNRDGTGKKRSLHSRTCPYFHRLTCLYTGLQPQPELELQEPQQ